MSGLEPLLWPVLIVLASAGWGSATQLLLSRTRQPIPEDRSLFSAAFTGMLVVTLGVLMANFWFGMGQHPGVWTIGIGGLLYGVALLKQPRWVPQSVVVIVSAALCYIVFQNMAFGYDAGLYHIPYMNWVAAGPVPLGLANLEGRLGFNSTWLLFVSSLRINRIFDWSHVLFAELAIRTLAAAWLAWGLLVECQAGWTRRGVLYLSSIAILSLYVGHRGGGGAVTSTDYAGNLCAFLAWVCFSADLLDEEGSAQQPEPESLHVLLALTALAVTSKLALAPIALLPVFMFWFRMRRLGSQWLRNYYVWTLILAAFLAAWIIRGFLMSGCFIFPAAATCIGVAWSVPLPKVKMISSAITGWARHPGPAYEEYTDLFDATWLADWVPMFVRSPAFLILALAAAFTFASVIWVLPRKETDDGLADGVRPWLLGSAIVSFAGFLLWFIRAPDPRFAWSFFAIAAAAMITWSLSYASYTLPTMRLRPLGRPLGYSLLLGCALSLAAMFWWTPFQPPSPPVDVISSGNHWQAFHPTMGDQCWTYFPCAHDPIDDLDVQVTPHRLAFISREGRAVR